MIQSFACKETEKIFLREFSKKLPHMMQRLAMKKLWIIHAATTLETLKIPPSNHLEALRGDRKGQHSIRINGQYRICFKWQDGNASDVEIVDYH